MFSHIEDNTSTPKKVSFAKAGESKDVVVHTPQSKNKYVHSQYENVESIQPTYAQIVKQKRKHELMLISYFNPTFKALLDFCVFRVVGSLRLYWAHVDQQTASL